MIGLDTMDQQQAVISSWNASISMAVSSRPQFMEPLPSQAIRFADPSTNNTDPLIKLKQQSKDGFNRFHLKGT
jgi:hypothetical protein